MEDSNCSGIREVIKTRTLWSGIWIYGTVPINETLAYARWKLVAVMKIYVILQGIANIVI